MSEWKIGHYRRPDRDWEVWNGDYSRTSGVRLEDPMDKGWVAYHPADPDLTSDGFDSLEEALDHIVVMELFHSDKLEAWRRRDAAA